MRRRARPRLAAAIGCQLLGAPSGEAGNLACLGGDCHGRGYAVYRSSDPGAPEWKAVCGDWRTDFLVLDDDRWEKREEDYRKHCPNGTVVYAKAQRTSQSLDRGFLAFFDRVIARARAEGRKVLFHRRLGTHRTGRLASYYELKHEGWSLDRAPKDFDDHVHFLTRLYGFVLNRRVRRQIRGLAAFLENPSACEADPGRECVVRTDAAAPKDPALRAAEERLRE